MTPSWPCLCSYRLQESPKLSQANGTPGILLAPQSRDGSPNPVHSKRAGEGLGMKRVAGPQPDRHREASAGGTAGILGRVCQAGAGQGV